MDYSDLIAKIELDYWVLFLGCIIIPIMLTILFIKIIHLISKKTDHFRKITWKSWIAIAFEPLLIAFTILIFLELPPVIKDFPNVRDNNYVIDTCVVIGQSSAGNPETPQNRSPLCRSESTGEEFVLSTFYTPMNIGEEYTIIYLSNTKLGRIINRIL